MGGGQHRTLVGGGCTAGWAASSSSWTTHREVVLGGYMGQELCKAGVTLEKCLCRGSRASRARIDGVDGVDDRQDRALCIAAGIASIA